MILSDTEILRQVKLKNIVIEPFNPKSLGSNSYDVHLGKHLAVYKNKTLDAKKHNEIKYIEIPKNGFVMKPGTLYLGITQEYTETKKHVPFLEGKSSTGRLGIQIHITAGKGDVGYANRWTLELTAAQPVRVYEGMPIAQLIYYEIKGTVKIPYGRKASAKYNEPIEKPKESMMYKNFPL